MTHIGIVNLTQAYNEAVRMLNSVITKKCDPGNIEFILAESKEEANTVYKLTEQLRKHMTEEQLAVWHERYRKLITTIKELKWS